MTIVLIEPGVVSKTLHKSLKSPKNPRSNSAWKMPQCRQISQSSIIIYDNICVAVRNSEIAEK